MCVFCNRYAWDFRRGKVKNHMSASDEKAPIFAHKHISKKLQCVSIFEKYFELFSESNTEKQTVKTVTCWWQNRHPSPTSADWVIQSRNTIDFMIYILKQLVLNKKFQMAKIIAMSTWPSPKLSLGWTDRSKQWIVL